MLGFNVVIDTTDQGNWDDEAVTALVEHVASQFDGSVGIVANAAIRDGTMEAKRKAMAMFFADKLPGGKLALANLNEPSRAATVAGTPLQPPTLEQWEDRALQSAANKANCITDKTIEMMAQRKGIPIEEMRQELWKVLFYGSLEDTWHLVERPRDAA